MGRIFGKSLNSKIERFEEFEERMQVNLGNLSVKVEDEDKWVTIFCEVHPKHGTNIDSDMDIECILYDKGGAIIGKENEQIYSDDFFGFEIVEFNFQEDGIADQIGKIKIYPKK